MFGCLWDMITWPVRLALGLMGWILSAVGSLIAMGIGLVICALGVALCFTLVGAIIGIPLIIFGGGLILRSIF